MLRGSQGLHRGHLRVSAQKASLLQLHLIFRSQPSKLRGGVIFKQKNTKILCCQSPAGQPLTHDIRSCTHRLCSQGEAAGALRCLLQLHYARLRAKESSKTLQKLIPPASDNLSCDGWCYCHLVCPKLPTQDHLAPMFRSVVLGRVLLKRHQDPIPYSATEKYIKKDLRKSVVTQKSSGKGKSYSILATKKKYIYIIKLKTSKRTVKASLQGKNYRPYQLQKDLENWPFGAM